MLSQFLSVSSDRKVFYVFKFVIEDIFKKQWFSKIRKIVIRSNSSYFFKSWSLYRIIFHKLYYKPKILFYIFKRI